MEPLRWSTDNLSPSERVGAWRAIAEQVFGPLTVRPGSEGPFRASLRSATVGVLRFAEISGSGHRSVRDLRPHTPEADLAVVNIQLEGWSRTATNDDFLVTPPGRISLICTPGPEVVDVPDGFRQLLITFRSDLFGVRLAGLGSGCGRMLDDDAAAELVVRRAAHLLEHGHELEPALAELAGWQLAQLVVEAFAQQAAREESARSVAG